MDTYARAKDVKELLVRASELRTLVLEMVWCAGSGHPGASFSAADIVAALYFNIMRHRPQEPLWPERDRFLLSKGHAVPIVYAALALSGYFPLAELRSLRKLGSRLPGHPDLNSKTPGIEMSSGSLGQGLSYGIGVASAGRFHKRSYNTYVLVGDGECNEGQVWEAVMLAPHWKLDSLIAIVDRNDIPVEGPKGPITPLGDMSSKWAAFGWETYDINGHDMEQLVEAISEARSRTNGKPKAIIAKTVKGRGLRVIEESATYHADPLPDDLLREAIKELSPSGKSYLGVP